MKKFFLLTVISFFAVTTQAQQYPEMITVEGGTFEMGDKKGFAGNEEPVHTVTLKSFSIAKTETTVLQWKTFCNATGRNMPETPSWNWIDNHPIVNVSWDDAVAYCDWMSNKTGKKYSLPTEAEWEYAARGGKLSKGHKYSGGKSIDGTGWYKKNSGDKTNAVAQKLPNELGLYDMSGNVFEWCQDRYGYYSAEAQTNPIGSKPGRTRVVRSGGWNYTADYCLVTTRQGINPDSRFNFFGFRVVVPE